MADGAPMHRVLQLLVRDLPVRPAMLDDVEMLTLFVADELPIDTPNEVGWCLRTYDALDGLRPLEPQSCSLKPFPLAFSEVEDWPCRDDVPPRLLALWDEHADEDDELYRAHEGLKIGGWPSCVQSEVDWYDGDGGAIPDVEFVLQVDSDHKVGFVVGDAGVFTSAGGAEPACGTQRGRALDRDSRVRVTRWPPRCVTPPAARSARGPRPCSRSLYFCTLPVTVIGNTVRPPARSASARFRSFRPVHESFSCGRGLTSPLFEILAQPAPEALARLLSNWYGPPTVETAPPKPGGSTAMPAPLHRFLAWAVQLVAFAAWPRCHHLRADSVPPATNGHTLTPMPNAAAHAEAGQDATRRSTGRLLRRYTRACRRSNSRPPWRMNGPSSRRLA